MSQFLLTHGFHFLQQDEIDVLKLQELSDDAEDRYILEVDLHYATHMVDRHEVILDHINPYIYSWIPKISHCQERNHTMQLMLS